MRIRRFFIVVFLISTLVGVNYFIQFLQDHNISGVTITPYFIGLVMISIGLLMAAHYVRAYKSTFILNLIRKSKVPTLFNGVAVGFLFNSILPFRLGEFVRAYFVGDSLSISKTVVFISIIIERIVDGTILGVSFITAALLIKSSSVDAYSMMLQFGSVLILISILLAGLVYFIQSENKASLKIVSVISGIFNNVLSDRLKFMAWSGIYGTRLMTSHKKILVRFWAASVFMWLLYFASAATVVTAFFKNVPIGKAWLITQSSYAGVSVPSGPGYIGTFHEIVTDLTQMVGLGRTSSFSILIWAVSTIPISVVGLLVLVRKRFGENSLVKQQDALINKLYREKDISPELSHFLDAYFKGERINQLLTQAELNGDFKLIKSFRGGSNAHTMLVWQNEELRVKKITLPQFASKLEDQANWLIERSHLRNIPKVRDQVTSKHYYYFDLAYEEDFFPFFDFIHTRTEKENDRVLKKALSFMKKEVYRPQPVLNGLDNLMSYIDGKVLTKVTDTATLSASVNGLISYPKIKINGKTYMNLFNVVSKIKANRKIMDELSSYEQSPIHGDLTIDNMIVSAAGEFMVIDPNNENQVSAPVVDYGKLYQSLHSGYEFLIQLEKSSIEKNSIDYEESKSHKYEALFRTLENSLSNDLTPEQYRSIIFHEAVHYCRMLPYRVKLNPETVPVFYATAVKLFNEFYEQYAK